MTSSRDPDRLIHQFLLEGEEQLQDQVFDAVRASIEYKRQRAFLGPWRTPIMNKLVPIGLGSAAVVAVLIVGSQLIGPDGFSGIGDEPTARPQPSVAAPTATPEPSPSAAADLAEGPFVFFDGSLEGAPTITATIPASQWFMRDESVPTKNGNGYPPDGAYVLGPWVGFDFYVPGDPCHWRSTQPDAPATTLDAIVTALANQATRDASEPIDVTLDGHPGKSITLHVPDDVGHNGAEFDCTDGLFCTLATTNSCNMWNARGPGAIDELWIVDVDGEILAVTGAYYPETPAEHVEELRAILGSMTFSE